MFKKSVGRLEGFEMKEVHLFYLVDHRFIDLYDILGRRCFKSCQGLALLCHVSVALLCCPQSGDGLALLCH